ncbi:hypothetical protein LXL04_001804 [Taraxacum kok-saghyz]
MMRSPCCEKDHTNKGAWTKEEDERLVSYINAHGESSSRSLPKSAGLNRCGKSCRLRWINYLRPDLKRGNFTPQEDQLIVSLHAVLGNKYMVNDCIKITGIYAMDHDRAITKVKFKILLEMYVDFCVYFTVYEVISSWKIMISMCDCVKEHLKDA